MFGVLEKKEFRAGDNPEIDRAIFLLYTSAIQNQPEIVADECGLPAPREQIEKVMLWSILNCQDKAGRDMLKEGFLMLADFVRISEEDRRSIAIFKNASLALKDAEPAVQKQILVMTSEQMAHYGKLTKRVEAARAGLQAKLSAFERHFNA